MSYIPEIGLFGNVKRLCIELPKTNANVSRTQNSMQQMDARVAANEEVNNITFVALAETRIIDDDTAARHAQVFEEWRPGVNYKPGQMRRSPVNGKLYRLNDGQAHTSIEAWEPSLVPAVWTVVDVTHAGTREDPIPAARSMEYTFGLYYTDPEDGKLYICQRTGEVAGGTITLAYFPHELVGQYFEEVAM